VNKKAAAALAIGIFMLMNINTPLAFAADSAAEQPGIQIEKNVKLIMKGAKVQTGKEKKDINSAIYKVNLKFIKEFEKNEKLVLHLNGENGDQAADIAKITELYYQRSFLNNKITASFGKLNLGENILPTTTKPHNF